MVKNLPVIETWVRSLVQGEPLEKGMAKVNNILNENQGNACIRKVLYRLYLLYFGASVVAALKRMF